MRVTVCATVDIEEQVDVSIEDFLMEFDTIVSDATPEKRARLLTAIDGITRTLASLDSETIKAINPKAQEIVIERLEHELAKWKAAVMQYPVRVIRATLHPRLRLRMVAFVVRHFTWDELQPFDEFGELKTVEVRHTTYVMVSLGRRRLPACVEIAIAKYYFRGNIESVVDMDKQVGLPK